MDRKMARKWAADKRHSRQLDKPRANWAGDLRRGWLPRRKGRFRALRKLRRGQVAFARTLGLVGLAGVLAQAGAPAFPCECPEHPGGRWRKLGAPAFGLPNRQPPPQLPSMSKLCFLLSLALLAAAQSPAFGAAAAPPNIVFILADDK